jgi:hypothetical protein
MQASWWPCQTRTKAVKRLVSGPSYDYPFAIPPRHDSPTLSLHNPEPQHLALEADWLVDNLALFVLQILPGYIFRTSVIAPPLLPSSLVSIFICSLFILPYRLYAQQDAVLDVWQGLVERVARLYAQDPESKVCLYFT